MPHARSSAQRKLWEAVIAGDAFTVQGILDEPLSVAEGGDGPTRGCTHEDVNAPIKGDTLLFTAASLGHDNVVQTLLDSRRVTHEHVNEACEHARTVLHAAIESGNVAAVAALLRNQRVAFATIHAVDADAATALLLAARSGNLELLRVVAHHPRTRWDADDKAWAARAARERGFTAAASALSEGER